MNICKIRRAEETGAVLVQGLKSVNVPIFNECGDTRARLSSFGRALSRVEVGVDFTNLLAFAEQSGIPQEGDFKVVSGRFESNKTDNAYNCIIVSFGIGKEFAFYGIHQEEHPEFFTIYERIREVSRFEISVKA